MSRRTLPPLDRECFFIAPIGTEGSEQRERSDLVMEYVVAPAALTLGLVTVRADEIAEPVEVNQQVLEHVTAGRGEASST